MDAENILQKRPRGRPRGTGKDDTATLAKVADMLAACPNMAPTTAMRRCITKDEPSHLRRLQEKWKVDGPRLRIEAGKRAQQRRDAQMIAELKAASQGARELGHWYNTVLVPTITPAMQTIHDLAQGIGQLRQLSSLAIASAITPAMEANLRELALSISASRVGSPTSVLVESIATQFARESPELAKHFAPLAR